MEEPKFVVLEGSDGSGKTTQLKLLEAHFEKLGLEYVELDFPQYKTGFWGKTVARFLAGEFGELESISPYLIQPHYMLDQASKAGEIENSLKQGKFVLANRYITSSMAHQTSRLPIDEQEEFLKWVQQAGYGELGVYPEDLVIVLYLNPQVSYHLLQERLKEKGLNTGKERDIAEENFEHQAAASEMYMNLCSKFSHWHLINCSDCNNGILPAETIHGEVIRLLTDLQVISK